MADDLVIVPSDGDGYVQLAKTKTGRIFKKHLLNYGDLRHPVTGKLIKVDDTFAQTLKKNFDNGVCDIVQVPLADKDNEHTEDPDRNIGEVVDLEVADDKVYAILDVRDNDRADKLGKTILGASAMLHLDYTNTKTGEKVGPTLLHSCATNRPYVTGLETYQEIVAATSDTSKGAVLLTADVVEVEAIEEPTAMGDNTTESTTTAVKPTLEELLTALKADHNIDVTALQAKAAEGDATASLSKTLTDALTAAGVIKLTATDDKAPSTEDVVTAVSELAKDNVGLTDRVNRLEREGADTAVQALVDEGRLTPAQKTGFVELKLTLPAEKFDALVPATPIVKLNNETGVTPPKDDAHVKDVDAEIARLSALFSGTPQK